MKRLAILVSIIFVCLGINAQADGGLRFGYLSYEAALQSMPDYTVVQKKLADLRQQFQNETLRFKEHGRMEIEKAEQDLMAPLKIRLIEVLGKIGRERGYAFIVDTDTKALPFINPAMGQDLNQQVQDALK